MLAKGGYRVVNMDAAALEAEVRRARLLRAATKLRRVFTLPVPDSPGLVFFAGEADPAVLGPEYAGMPVGFLAGSGTEPERAFEACVGEGVEYLSQFVSGGHLFEAGGFEERRLGNAASTRFVAALLSACGIARQQRLDWIRAERVPDGEAQWFPADLCVRRPAAARQFVAPLKLSTGCAAGPTEDAARLRALLELIERDAAALWWRGGRRGRAIPERSAAGAAAAGLLARVRRGLSARPVWLLDITTDIGVPVVAAVSSGPDGFGFAYGLGARTSMTEAACAAIFELCQVELAPHLVEAKRRESGDAALSDGDRGHLRRVTMIDTRACALLQPEGFFGGEAVAIPTDPAAAVREITKRLTEFGIEVFSLLLTRPEFEVPVVRVLAPGLQLDPSDIVGERLERAIREIGGGALHTAGVSLF